MTRLLAGLALSLVGCGSTPSNLVRAPLDSDAQLPGGPGTSDPGDPSDPSDPADPSDPTDPAEDPTDPTLEDPTTGSDPCPPGVLCVDTLPFTDANTTSGGASTLDGYSCSPSTDESGPEVVYQLELAETGLLVASLDNLGAGVDVDVHVLEQLDAGDCIDRGHWDSAALLGPGTYHVVVDSWVDAGGLSQEGSYELRLELTTADQYAADGLSDTVLEAGLMAFDRAWSEGETSELEYGIIDYTLPSTEPRFFVLDLRQGDLLFAELTTHGIGSQDPYDITRTGLMSNVSGSNASSVGLVRAAETYYGSKGYSLRLDGLESGFNNNDRTRAIVIHGADYATQDFLDDYGYLGRSWGCPALDWLVYDQLIDTISDGRLVLKYFDDPDWLTDSTYINP